MNKNKNTILLSHGSGGKLSHDLVKDLFLARLGDVATGQLDDSAIINSLSGRIAFTTDSYVITPQFFPGGDIGKLAICGTVNDLAMVGASPHVISCAFILEEGFPIGDLETIVDSMRKAAEEAGVKIAAGDTKTVSHGEADGVFINTSGIGTINERLNISGSNAQPGDKVIVSGSIGDHGISVLSHREGLDLDIPIESDCAPLNGLVDKICKYPDSLHAMRDPTRGGLATALNEIATQSNCSIEIEESLVPIKDPVRGTCEILGLDPLYVANEGKLIAIVDPADAQAILDTIKEHRYGADAVIIGTVTEKPAGQVVLKTLAGTRRVLPMLTGEQLPRIC